MQPSREEVDKRKKFIKENYYNMSNSQIAQELGISEKSVRKHSQRMELPPKATLLTRPEQCVQGTSLFENKLAENLLPHKWTYGWLKTNEASIFVKNPEDIIRLEDMKKEWLESIKKKAPKYTKFTYKKLKNPHLMVIDPADVHIGKLSSKSETGSTYNVETAINRVVTGVQELVNKAQGFPVDKMLLVIGNDIFHTDNPKHTTTAGTPQDTDGQWFDNYKKAFDMYVEIIDTMSMIAPVHVIHCPSNHYWTSGFYLAQSLGAYYSKNPNVTFDITIRHRKYFQYGKNLLGFSHGDGAKENDLVNIMASETKNMWSATDFRYWYLYHKHHMNKIKYSDGKDYIGATIEYLRAVSGADGWHDRNGYLSPQSIYCFIHENTSGQIARIMHHFV